MKNVSRPVVITVFLILALAIAAYFLSTMSFTLGEGPMITISGEDYSDSALAWFIVIPVLIIVAAIVFAVLAGAALITVLAILFTVLMLVLAALLVATPFVLFIGIPLLAIYGFVKLIQRDARQMSAA